MPPLSSRRKSKDRLGALSAAEEKILRAAAHLPFFTAEDMTRLLSRKGSQGSHYRALLKTLSVSTPDRKTAYLHPFEMPQSAGNSRRIYTLTRRGAGLLRRLGVDASFWYRPWKASHHSFSFINHHLAVSKILVSLFCFVRVFPAYQVVELRHGFTLARKPPLLTQSVDGKESSLPVIPDCWVYVERAEGTPPTIQGFPLWVEIDCGTETKAKFQHLLLQRIHLIRSKGYEAYFGTPAVLICYLAVGATTDYRLRRLRTMREWTAAVLNEQQLTRWTATFRFSTIDEYLYDTLMLFTDPVWYLPDSDTLVPLFTHPKTKE